MIKNRSALSKFRRPWPVRVFFAPLIILLLLVMFLALPFYTLVPILSRRKGVQRAGSKTMFGVAQQRLLGYKAGLCDDHLAYLVVPAFYRVFEWIQLLIWEVYRTLSDKAYGAARCNYADEAVVTALEEGITQFVYLTPRAVINFNAGKLFTITRRPGCRWDYEKVYDTSGGICNW